ncbi:MAG: hypothetical protein N3F65_01240 [Nitrososphaeria archaeon]|nr:hypothetical protein [Aigarchaeota archaeon]MCX8187218.1 hypothetical protein [Nitrososphaeria archaeon]MDW8021699.1 hypothetical protein [Nitrososphaerota archaeon]
MRVLVDASFLLLCAERGRDFISLAEESLGEKLECYVLDDVLRELKGLMARGGKRGALAGVALKIAEKMNKMKSLLPGTLGVDQKLIEEAKKQRMILASIDMDLISKAREMGVPILTVRRDQSIFITRIPE